MSLSVVIRSRDEADRLRLTLTSLQGQADDAEVVVVNDGSRDHTDAVLDEASGWPALRIVRHETSVGRSAAANAGAGAASGDILLFLDGDTLAGPGLLRRHAAAHAHRPNLMARGETFHLRCTRFLADPESASPKPGEEQRLARLAPAEIERMRITRRQILEDFVAAKPTDAFARYGLAMECANSGDPSAAAEHFKALLASHPEYVAGYFQFGQFLVKSGRTEEARATLNAGIATAQRTGDEHARSEMEAALAELG